MGNLVGKTVSVTRWNAVGVVASCLLMPNVALAASSDQIVMHIDGSVAIVFAVILVIILALLLYPRIKQMMPSAGGPNDARLVLASEISDSPAAGAAVPPRGPDLDRRRRNEELLTSYVESDQLYAAVVQSANDAIVTKTLDGKITGWNPGAGRMFGYSAAEVIGKPIDIIIPPDRRGDLQHILDRVGRGEYIDHNETVRTAKDGRMLDVSLSISPVKSATGDISGAAKIARDMTEQKKLRAQLLQAQKMEAVVLMAGGVAMTSAICCWS